MKPRRKNKFRSYRFAGAWFHQRPLLYHEDCAVREIIRKQVGAVPDPDDHDGLSRAIRKLWDTAGYAELFRVILKPGKGPGVRNRAQFLLEARGRKLADTGVLLRSLDRLQIAEVMRDFFIYRQSWVEDFFDATLTTDALRELEKLGEMVQRQQKKDGGG